MHKSGYPFSNSNYLTAVPVSEDKKHIESQKTYDTYDITKFDITKEKLFCRHCGVHFSWHGEDRNTGVLIQHCRCLKTKFGCSHDVQTDPLTSDEDVNKTLKHYFEPTVVIT